MPIDPATAAQVKAQAISANQESANDKAPQFRAEAAEKSKHAAVLSNAVDHLNKQMGREPKLGWTATETQP
jgi:hypothetical protein